MRRAVPLVHPDAEVIFGAAIDEALGDEIKVTVIATGFDDRRGQIIESEPEADWQEAPAEDEEPSSWGDRPTNREASQQPLGASQAGSDPRTRNVFADLPEFGSNDTELPAFLRRNVTAR